MGGVEGECGDPRSKREDEGGETYIAPPVKG